MGYGEINIQIYTQLIKSFGTKLLRKYRFKHVMFKEAIKIFANNARIIDGTDCITRIENTYTTHFRNPVPNYNNDGEEPYPGITNDTCSINFTKIRNNNIVLIDDIYTESVNIDEDCIQALLDAGAKCVIFYAIAYTGR